MADYGQPFGPYGMGVYGLTPPQPAVPQQALPGGHGAVPQQALPGGLGADYLNKHFLVDTAQDIDQYSLADLALNLIKYLLQYSNKLPME